MASADWEEEAGTNEEIWGKITLDETDWERVPGITEEAKPAQYGEYSGHANYKTADLSPLGHFLQWFPLTIMYGILEKWNQSLRNKFQHSMF